jgi:hypothetical protein
MFLGISAFVHSKSARHGARHVEDQFDSDVSKLRVLRKYHFPLSKKRPSYVRYVANRYHLVLTERSSVRRGALTTLNSFALHRNKHMCNALARLCQTEGLGLSTMKQLLHSKKILHGVIYTAIG